ncbi:hypothetical protein BOX15_Mlig021403g1 [Macrostomum lignano]|uniref:Uncharacterized protein n=1 Tax=Macrostomum lignano TaxID=282301 RepID=A0A267GDS0_9PLAT|nr:hypothetical protein BOX15_Mlig021403g1 [Macrostomum lignano]
MDRQTEIMNNEDGSEKPKQQQQQQQQQQHQRYHSAVAVARGLLQLSVAKALQQRRKRSGIDLRRSLLIAGMAGRARDQLVRLAETASPPQRHSRDQPIGEHCAQQKRSSSSSDSVELRQPESGHQDISKRIRLEQECVRTEDATGESPAAVNQRIGESASSKSKVQLSPWKVELTVFS